MAKSQKNGTTILSGLKGFEVGTVTESEGRVIVEVKAEQGKPVCPPDNQTGRTRSPMAA